MFQHLAVTIYHIEGSHQEIINSKRYSIEKELQRMKADLGIVNFRTGVDN